MLEIRHPLLQHLLLHEIPGTIKAKGQAIAALLAMADQLIGT